MARIKIYHNTKWSKSRQTLDVLKTLGVDFEIIEYIKAPPSPAELDKICQMLGVEPLQIIRVKDKKFKALGLSPAESKTRQEWLQLMSASPSIIERPIVVNGDKAAIGRPPESIKAIID